MTRGLHRIIDLQQKRHAIKSLLISHMMDCGIMSDWAIFSCANSSTQEIITSQKPQYMYSNNALFSIIV